MAAKADLGGRFVCFSCECRFYDLGAPAPLCPRCGADQRENPNPTPPPGAKPKRSRKKKTTAKKTKAKAAPKAAAKPELEADDGSLLDDDFADDKATK